MDCGGKMKNSMSFPILFTKLSTYTAHAYPTILCSFGWSSICSKTSHMAADRSSLVGDPPQGMGAVLLLGERREEVEDEGGVNCHMRVMWVISRGIPIGFFSIKPTATGSAEGSRKKAILRL